jgi:queuine tRNA-ribosyltransferase subunit QTRTD1
MAPRRTPAVSAPHGNTDGGVSVYTSNGFYSLKAKTYAEYVKTLKPDIAIALGDVPYGPLPGVKRTAKMGDRTSIWVDEFLSDLSKSDETNSKSTAEVFAPVLPIPFVNQWEYLNHVADDLVTSISGLAFYSSSLLPEIPATTAISRLPRLSLDNPHSPHEILRQISLGMDIFTVPFVGFATDGGVALTFEFPAPSTSENENAGTTGPTALASDLSLPIHASSTTPLSRNCTCYACTQHHRAYIQHLLHAKEMLGWVLLNIHNHAVLSRFFQGVRESITNGTFEKNKEAFERFYEAEIAQGQGQKPRARGYHFKSEGPGERKKNKPAWGSLGDGHGGEKEKKVKKVEEDRVRPEEAADVLDEMGFAEKVEMEGEEAK